MEKPAKGVYPRMPKRFTTKFLKPRESCALGADVAWVGENHEFENFWRQPEEGDESDSPPQQLDPYQQHLMSILPRRERQALQDWANKIRQNKAARKRGRVTQSAVSYRLSSAYKRLQLLRQLPRITWDLRALRKAFSAFLGPADTLVACLFVRCWSSTVVSRHIPRTQGWAHRQLRLIAERLPEGSEPRQIIDTVIREPFLLRTHGGRSAKERGLWRPFKNSGITNPGTNDIFEHEPKTFNSPPSRSAPVRRQASGYLGAL